MTVFLDTSFLYAFMDGSDHDHRAAAGAMATLLENGTRLATSN